MKKILIFVTFLFMSFPVTSTAEFVDNGNGTTTDTETGLIWQQPISETEMSWYEAKTYCQNLDLAGYNDWRLPDKEELAPVYPDKIMNKNFSSTYWSSTEVSGHDELALYVFFQYEPGSIRRSITSGDKSVKYFVRAVRDGEFKVLTFDELEITPTYGTAPLHITFQASISGGEPPYNYHFEFGDGNSLTTENTAVSHTYTKGGSYQVICTVTDNENTKVFSDHQVFVKSTMPKIVIDSIDPKAGKTGQNCDVVINGSGFYETLNGSVSLDTGNTGSIIGFINCYNAGEIKVVDNIAYVADDEFGLQIIDVNNVENTETIGSMDTPSDARGLDIVNKLAYVIYDYDYQKKGGLQIIDVNDSENPKLIGSLELSDKVRGIEVKNQIAYVANAGSGLQIIDVSSPENPTIAATVETTGKTYDVTVVDQIAYLAVHGEGLQIVDVSETTDPVKLGAIKYTGNSWANAVTVVNQTAYVADGLSGLHLIDVGNPANPTEIGSFETPAGADNLTIEGWTAYVADNLSGLYLVDVSNPANPTRTGYVSVASTSIEISDQKAYVAGRGWGNGVYIIDRNANLNVKTIGSIESMGSVTSITKAGQTVYLIDDTRFQVIDASDPLNPIIQGSLEISGRPNDIAIQDTTAYVTDASSDNSKGLEIIDVSNPEAPSLISTVKTPNQAEAVSVENQNAYIVGNGNGLQIVDVNDPKTPVIINSIDTLDDFVDITVKEGIAYVLTQHRYDRNSGLQIIDLTDPLDPKTIGSLETPGRAEDITVMDKIAYVADGPGHYLQVIDVSVPSNPVIIGSVYTPDSPVAVTVVNQTVYVANRFAGLQKIDISDPKNPAITGSVNTPGNASDVTIIDKIAYIADGGEGLSIVPIPQEITQMTIKDYTELEATLPIQEFEGNYKVRLFDNTTSDSIVIPFNEDGKIGTLKWNYSTGSWTRSSPAIDDNMTLYIGSADNKLYAVNPDGTIKWSYQTEDEIWSAPVIDSDGIIYIGSTDDNLYAVNPDGTLQWSYQTGGAIYSASAIGKDGTIYVGSHDGKLYAINPDSSLKWSYQTGNSITCAPSIGYSNTIFVASHDGRLYAINQDGTLKWSYLTNGAIESSSPAINDDGTIYVGSTDKSLYAIHPDGTLKWRYQTGNGKVSSAPAIGSDDTVYVGSSDKNLYAVNPDGTLKWSYQTGGEIFSSPAVGLDGTLYIGSWDNYLHAVNSDGSLKWRFKTGNHVDSYPAIDRNGTIYFGSHDGNLYAVNGNSGGLADSSWPMFGHDSKHTSQSRDHKADVNGDGLVDFLDLIVILRVGTGFVLDQRLPPNVDINHDGKIGLPEAVFVLQNIARTSRATE